MKTTVVAALRFVFFQSNHAGRVFPAICASWVLAAGAMQAAESGQPMRSTWPQAYKLRRDNAAGALVLRTPYYEIEHDLKRGGSLGRISLTHGRAGNLLARPLGCYIRDEAGVVFSDQKDPAPTVMTRQEGLNETVDVRCALKDVKGQPSGVRVRTTFEYRWGYVKIHRELVVPSGGVEVLEVCPVNAVLTPAFSQFGYRDGRTEAEGLPPFDFGSNRWGKLGAGQVTDPVLETQYIPHSMLFADPGVEGLEWFVSSDLSQWGSQLTGRRGDGRCLLRRTTDPVGWALTISPLRATNGAVRLTKSCVFDFYVSVPLLEGHANPPWLHASFNRNHGNWVSTEQVKRWAEEGVQTVHCHNDGDYYDDGLFWRDGSYPPYPDMTGYDKVLQDCRQAGIRTATYFSNKELHPSTKEFQEHGETWGRMDRKGDLQHNFFRGKSEFGAQMCLRSGWLKFLEFSIDRVLSNHPLDGVYFDWNVALACYNPRHEGKETSASVDGHWDIDELLELMEWTRKRVGPDGLVIVHNTTTPMFATENFADDVVATEWGYRKWTDRAPDLEELPLEWSLAGARPRGVISYGTIDSKAPRRLHRLFALEAFLGGSTPWPASPETFELLPLLKPIGDISTCRFLDWRNEAVTLSDGRCASAVYSRPGEAYLLLANLDAEAKEVSCLLRPEKLPHPLAHPGTAVRLVASTKAEGQGGGAEKFEISLLLKEGLKLTIPGDGAILLQVK